MQEGRGLTLNKETVGILDDWESGGGRGRYAEFFQFTMN